MRSLPVGINSFPIGSFLDNPSGFIRVQGDGNRDVEQIFRLGDVFSIRKVCPKSSAMEGIPLALRLRPFGQFLGQSTVIGFRASSKRKPFSIGDCLQMCQNFWNVIRPTGK